MPEAAEASEVPIDLQALIQPPCAGAPVHDRRFERQDYCETERKTFLGRGIQQIEVVLLTAVHLLVHTFDPVLTLLGRHGFRMRPSFCLVTRFL